MTLWSRVQVAGTEPSCGILVGARGKPAGTTTRGILGLAGKSWGVVGIIPAIYRAYDNNAGQVGSRENSRGLVGERIAWDTAVL